MPGACRLGDKAKCPIDAHGCIACPHSVSGPVTQGSSDVIVNGKPIARKVDGGVHGVCCSPNRFVIAQGSSTVTANGKPVARNGDITIHCGGMGKMVLGSSNVIIGDGKSRALRIASEMHAPFLYKDWNGEWQAGFPPDDYWPNANPEYGGTKLPGGGYNSVNCRIFRDPATISQDNQTWRRPIVKDGKVYPAEGTRCEQKTIPLIEEAGNIVRREYEEKTFIVSKDENGFPEFTIFETYLDDGHINSGNDKAHFQAANACLGTLLKENPNLADQMGLTDSQVTFLAKTNPSKLSPPGLTWHHHQQTGKMQLVDKELHRRFGHIGGMEMWGGSRP